jgi:hypothetical protein
MTLHSKPLTEEQKAQTAYFFREIYDTTLKGGGAVLDDANFGCQTIRCSVNGMIAQASRNIQDTGVSFVSVNIFKQNKNGYFRRTDDFLWRFNHIVIDIDFMGDFMPDYNALEEQLIQNIRWYAESYGIPMPTHITFSGSGGCHLYYKFESLPNGFDRKMVKGIQATKMKLIARWVECESNLVKYVEGFKVDDKASDSSRVFRVPGSIHEETGRMCRIMRTGIPTYSYKALCAALDECPWNGTYAIINASRDIEYIRSGFKKKQSAFPFASQMTSEWLGSKRIYEMFALARSGWGFWNCREKAAHLMWVWCRDTGLPIEECEEKLCQLNDMYHTPLSKRELLRTARGNDKSYYYTNNSIRSVLGLDGSEGFFVGHHVREFKDREGKAKRHKKLIAALVMLGKKISEIADELRLSISIVKRRRTEIKKSEGFKFWAAVKI